MPDFIDAEEIIRKYFSVGTRFQMDGQEYVVQMSGKPQRNGGRGGEPKTDIYVLAESIKGEKKEIKISYKKKNADFLENKMADERAKQIFGENWREIIEENTETISEGFTGKKWIHQSAAGKTGKGAITLGWKFELLNKPAGDLSGKMNMTKEQVFEVYAGEKLVDRLKNAKVNNRVIVNSGVAEYILVADDVTSAQDVINQMQKIIDYIEEHPDVYFACKALNYRTFESKYDGDRPLSVQVDWMINNNKLNGELVFNKPLEQNGREMANRLLECMKCLQIKNTDDINQTNTNMNIVHK